MVMHFSIFLEFLIETFLCFNLEHQGGEWHELNWEASQRGWSAISRSVCSPKVSGEAEKTACSTEQVWLPLSP